MKRIGKAAAWALAVVFLFSLAACKQAPQQEKYSASFFDSFDTVITVYGYAESEEAFNEFLAKVHTRFYELHRIFNAYEEYEDLNNLYSINEAAGKTPLSVPKELRALLNRSLEMYRETDGRVNIALGAVLRLWEQSRAAAIAAPDKASLPDEKALRMAGEHTDIGNLQIDDQAGTVYLADPLMSLDVGAVAKGYACQLVRQEMEAAGYTDFVISAGGNVAAVGNQGDGATPWSVGIQNPDTQMTANLVDTVLVHTAAVVTAGSYQRYFTVKGVRYNHIIDPATLYPATYFDSVTVICEDSFLADFLSTTLFILSPEAGRALVARMDGVEAFWVETDGSVFYSEGYPAFSETY